MSEEHTFALVFEGPKDDSPNTMRALKGVFIAELGFSIDDVQRFLTEAPIAITRAGSEKDLDRSYRLLKGAGAKVLIVRPSTSTGAQPQEIDLGEFNLEEIVDENGSYERRERVYELDDLTPDLSELERQLQEASEEGEAAILASPSEESAPLFPPEILEAAKEKSLYETTRETNDYAPAPQSALAEGETEDTPLFPAPPLLSPEATNVIPLSLNGDEQPITEAPPTSSHNVLDTQKPPDQPILDLSFLDEEPPAAAPPPAENISDTSEQGITDLSFGSLDSEELSGEDPKSQSSPSTALTSLDLSFLDEAPEPSPSSATRDLVAERITSEVSAPPDGVDLLESDATEKENSAAVSLTLASNEHAANQPDIEISTESSKSRSPLNLGETIEVERELDAKVPPTSTSAILDHTTNEKAAPEASPAPPEQPHTTRPARTPKGARKRGIPLDIIIPVLLGTVILFVANWFYFTRDEEITQIPTNDFDSIATRRSGTNPMNAPAPPSATARYRGEIIVDNVRVDARIDASSTTLISGSVVLDFPTPPPLSISDIAHGVEAPPSIGKIELSEFPFSSASEGDSYKAQGPARVSITYRGRNLRTSAHARLTAVRHGDTIEGTIRVFSETSEGYGATALQALPGEKYRFVILSRFEVTLVGSPKTSPSPQETAAPLSIG